MYVDLTELKWQWPAYVFQAKKAIALENILQPYSTWHPSLMDFVSQIEKIKVRVVNIVRSDIYIDNTIIFLFKKIFKKQDEHCVQKPFIYM